MGKDERRRPITSLRKRVAYTQPTSPSGNERGEAVTDRNSSGEGFCPTGLVLTAGDLEVPNVPGIVTRIDRNRSRVRWAQDHRARSAPAGRGPLKSRRYNPKGMRLLAPPAPHHDCATPAIRLPALSARRTGRCECSTSRMISNFSDAGYLMRRRPQPRSFTF
jgi:hypothetical protein